MTCSTLLHPVPVEELVPGDMLGRGGIPTIVGLVIGIRRREPYNGFYELDIFWTGSLGKYDTPFHTMNLEPDYKMWLFARANKQETGER